MVNKRVSCGKLRKKDASLPLFSVDDCLDNVPAAGYRNGSSLNNAGNNGNYWSSTPNENTYNAYNLNFNSGNNNYNWNNRNYGHSVRPVSELTTESRKENFVRRFSISKEQLLKDLYRAYKDARRNKRGRAYQLKFEFNLEENLVTLRDELLSGTYKPQPSNCFIIHDPKMREVFAANFRDRIVHHLFYNYIHRLFERSFIYDSYSCIKGRGTHFGINRLKHHIRSVSAGNSRPCFVLKIDIRSYFMSINRVRLLQLCRETLERMRMHESDVSGRTWGELLDYSFVEYMLEIIIFSDPVEGCNMLGQCDEWRKLPREKSLFFATENCGLPIGNLSSQLFSNVYMNIFDQYVKRTLGCKHYGRYVDDAYIVADSREALKLLIPRVSAFLYSQLGLTLNSDKTRIFNVRYGVEFLGAYLKPFRTYVSAASLKRMKNRIKSVPLNDVKYLQAVVNSYLGVFSHCRSFCLRRLLFSHLSIPGRKCFSANWLIFNIEANNK